ncbi:ABC transporter transmembrane domain-containing protein [Paenibacillus oryzisoli]|uniref:ABC transporter transmembrane domain-containing protein n=1 Tax=Paenibacillus oryzisoli TaxID=1850517 RepID=UPI003D2C4765
MPFLSKMLRFCARHKGLSALFLLGILLEIVYAVAAPLSLKYLVDDAFTPKDLHAFILILSALIIGGVMNIGASAGGDYAIAKLSGGFVRSLRGKLFDHMQKQSLSFYQRFKTGDLVTRYASDMGSIESVVRVAYPFLLREIFSVLLGLALLFTLNWKLTLAMLVGSTLMFAGPRLLQGRSEAANVDFKEAQERFANTIDEMVKGHKAIKGLHQQAAFQKRAGRQMDELFTLGFRLHMASAWLQRLPLTALLILNGIMIGFGGYLIFHDEISVGSFMAFFTLFLSVGQSGTNLSSILPTIIDAGTSFRRVEEILDAQPDVMEAELATDLPDQLPDVRLDRVTFGYTADAKQLKDVSLHVAAGGYAAFVGASGSGKSTALQLLARFYDPDAGEVLVSGTDLRQASEASLRRLAGLVAQETFLFNATVRENLLLDSGATEAEMVEAAKMARIHERILSWPLGYDTPILQEGGSLSGGERQRMAIARALLRKPKLLLLDEVTAALDPATEAEINALLEMSRGERTVISVTHRLASAVHTDAIFVFQDGVIVEAGTHRELLQRQGHYAALWAKQTGFHVSQDGLHATVEAERLARLPFFDGIAEELLGDLASLFTTEACQEGDVIVREGEQGDRCYIIVRGKVGIWKQVPGQGDVRVAVLQDGDHFGEIALLRNSPRNATVKAMGPAVLLSIRREAFDRLTAAHPQILQTLERTLADRL